MSPLYSLIGQNRSIGANAMEGGFSRSAVSRERAVDRWHDSIEREKQRRFQEEQRKKQEKAQRRAMWTSLGINAGAGAAGGAIVGGLAAAEAPIAASVIPQGINGAAQPALDASFKAASTVPAFAGGNVGGGAALGGLLGGIGGLGGGNYLPTAIAMPGQRARLATDIANVANDNAMGWTNISLNQKRLDEQVAHNLERETDDARLTDARIDWYKRRGTGGTTSTGPRLRMTANSDGTRNLSGDPTEVMGFLEQNPSAIGTAPTAPTTTQRSARYHDTIKRFQDMASRNAGDDEYWKLLDFQKKNGLPDDEYEELMRFLGQ